MITESKATHFMQKNVVSGWVIDCQQVATASSISYNKKDISYKSITIMVVIQNRNTIFASKTKDQ